MWKNKRYYLRYKHKKQDAEMWYCSNSSCNARLKLKKSSSEVLREDTHTCGEYAHRLTRPEVFKEFKKEMIVRVTENEDKAVTRIYKELRKKYINEGHSPDDLPEYVTIKSTMYKIRNEKKEKIMTT